MTPLAIITDEARGTALEARQAAQAARRRRAARGGHAVAYHDAARRAALKVAAAALEARDHGTSAHSDDVVVLCRAIAERLGIRGQERADLIAAAQLHDVGKVAVPGEITNKPGPLDELEWETMRQHTIVGEQILSSVRELKEVARIVRSCHERYDGGGYPDGLSGAAIPLASRVVFCADAFHAMRENRCYRKGRSAAKALAEISRNTGTQFDPQVVQALEDAARELRQAGPDRLASLSAPLRSRRLMALLLTLMVGGSTIAAAGLRLPIPFAGSDEPDAPEAVDPGCGAGCILDLGRLGRMPGTGSEGGSGTPLGPGIPFGSAGFGLGSVRSGRGTRPGAAGDPTGSAPGGPSDPAAGEKGGGGGSTAPGEQGAGSRPSEPGGGAGEQTGGGGGSESHGNGPGESGLPGGLPDVPVQLPDLPIELPGLPVQVPDLPIELPGLPVQVPKLPKLPGLP